MDLKNFVNDLTIADKIYLYNTLYEDLACKGIDGDTELAHVNKQEMAVLRAMGGSGTINPNTNLIQFGGGGGSPPPPPPATQTVTQQATIPDELKPFITDILEKSKAIQQRRESEGYVPFQGPRLADFTQEQTEAFEGIKELQGAGQPFYDTATALTASSALAPTSESVGQLMNPFIQNVIDVQTREALRQGDLERQQIGEAAVQAGGFGGSRHAILEAEQARNLQQRLGDIQARGQAAAFEDAQARLQQQRDRERQAGTQFASLGQQVPAQRLRELTGLEAIGAQKQALGQAGIDIAAQEFEIGRSFPERTLQDYQSIVRGYAQPIPASTLQRQATQQPAPSFLQQAAGLGAAGLGAFKAFGGNAQGGLVGLAEGGQADEGTTLLETQVEDISERAQTDPFGDRNRQALSQTQQFVRGREEEEAATVADQLKQIQGLALGATNAIAQGQRQLASMNTAPGVGAPPNNFGGNIGSFGFKKGGLLALKHLANGGIVKLAEGKRARTAPDDFNMSDNVKILYNMTEEEFRNPDNIKRFGILDVQEALKQRRLRKAFPPPEKSLSAGLRQRVLPSEGALGFGYDVQEPKGAFAKRILDAIGATDSNLLKVDPEAERRQLTVSDPGGAPTLPEEKSPFSQDVSRQVESLKKMVGPLGQPLSKAGQLAGSAVGQAGQYLFGTPESLAANQAQMDKLASQLTADTRYALGKDRDDLISDSFIRAGITDTPVGGPMKGRSVDEERFRQFNTAEGRAAEKFARQKAARKGKTVTPIEREIDARRQRILSGGATPREIEALENIRTEGIVKQGQEAMPTAFPRTAYEAGVGEVGPIPYDTGSLTDKQKAIAAGDPTGTGKDTRSTDLGVTELGAEVLNRELNPDDERYFTETKSITQINDEGAGKNIATEHAKANPEIASKIDAASTNSGQAATDGLYANLHQFLGDRRKETLANKKELDKLNAEQRQNLINAAGDRDRQEGLLILEAGLGILAQPGGQTFLQAIAKGVKDSNLIKGLMKLNDEQKQLATNLNNLDRKALKDKMGFDDRTAGLIMKGAELDIKAKESAARLRAATSANAWKRESAISKRIGEQRKALQLIGGDPTTKGGEEKFDKYYLSVVEDRSNNMPAEVRKTLLGDRDFALTDTDTWVQKNLLDNPVAKAAFKKEFFGLRDKEGEWTGPIDMERRIQKAVYAAFKAANQTYQQDQKDK